MTTDEELVDLAKRGSDFAAAQLVRRYRPLVRQRARRFYVLGAERDDVIQEGYIGLYKAMVRFDEDAATSFRTFAALCVTHQIQTAIEASRRHKHAPLNSALPLSPPDGGEDAATASLAQRRGDDPAEVVCAREERHQLARFLETTLTPLERDVLLRFLDGSSYDAIATTLRCQRKTVDNALQRIRRKVASVYLPAAA